VHDGDIFAFDTDDCCHHWFLEDLSSVLFYGRRHDGSSPDVNDFARNAWPEIWRGYRSEHELDPEWLDHLELFMQWRRITLFALIHMKFPPGDEMIENWRKVGRERIDPGEPIFGVDLRRLAESI
jgi:Ser/Thr protein kinase RdoA (MazF antagonist)